MNARRQAIKERRREQRVDEAFDAYMDHMVDRLVELGAESSAALEAIFEIVTYLAEKETLPEFPDDRATYREKGVWLVAAADYGLVDFVVEAVSG